MTSDPERRPFRTALARRDFRRLVTSMALSQAGDWLYNVALLVYVFDRTGSPRWVAVASIMRLAPYVLLGAVGGVIADRHDGRSVMVASDLIRAVFMVLLAVLAAVDGPVALVVLLAFLTTAGGTAYLPAVFKATPLLVPERELAAANAVRSTVDNVAVVLGPALGAFALALGSPTWAFAGNAVTFLAGAAITSGLQRLPGDPGADGSSVLRSIADGAGVLRRSANARWLLWVQMVASGTYGLQVVFLVLVADDLGDGGGSGGVGALYVGLGVGGVAVAGLTARLAEGRRPSISLSAGLVASALPLAALAAAGGLAVAVAVMVVQGAAWVVLEVISMTTLQRILPRDAVGRVYGIMDTLVVLSMLVGSLLASLLVEVLDLTDALVLSGAVLTAVGVVVLPRLLGFDHAAEARRTELAPQVALLQGLDLFEGASTRALESLAAASAQEPVAAGTTVVREGEPATAFFVLVDGALEVLSAGEVGAERVVNTLAPGDHFGEIGLVRRLPRTASVRATEDSVVLRIGGEAFLDAVSGDDRLGSALEPRIVSALRRTHPSQVTPAADASPTPVPTPEPRRGEV